MIKDRFQYKTFIIEKHVGGAKSVYIAFRHGLRLMSSTNLAWLKKDLTALDK
jgi:hypothetical protein